MGVKKEFLEKLKELEQRQWDVQAIEARFRALAKAGIPDKRLTREQMLADKNMILDRVQKRAEEYNYILKNCAQGTALALLEEFGLGNLQIVKALSNFPGIGGTGEMCGAVTGSLIAFGLYFAPDDILDCEAKGATMVNAQKFMALFKDKVGYLHCSEIQENVIFGKNMAPGASEENMKAFAEAKGFEKCGLAPGFGARLAAEFMVDEISE
jgi:C_GCAxxG_C_C family probable redox protein